MSPEQAEIAIALSHCGFLPASSDKRFARDMARLAVAKPDHELTEKQDRYLRLLAWRYRRQMPARLIPSEKPGELHPTAD